MKRFFALILLVSCLLSGCSVLGERIKEPVTFYYLRSEYTYFSQDGVIASEQREASGHKRDLPYLLALYLMGPASEDLVATLPQTVKVFSAEETSEGIMIHLSETDDLTDMEFSSACACLAMTCFELTTSDTVIIRSGERSLTVTKDDLLLFDNYLSTEDTK